MKVYLEITYIMNAFLILLTFEILCYLLNVRMAKKQLCMYVLSYNISIFLLYVDVFLGFLFIYDLIISCIFFRKLVYIYYPIYIFVYISLLSFLSFSMPGSCLFQGILLIEEMEIGSYMFLSLCLCLIVYLYVSYCHLKVKPGEMIDVTFQCTHCLGFIDNGNKVYYKGYPVIFISRSLLPSYQKIDTMMIETANQKEEVDIMMLDQIKIHHYLLKNVYVGVMSSSHYDCIIHANILGGMM